VSDHELPGGVIDIAHDPIPRRAILPRWVKAMVACALVLASASCLLSVVLYGRTQRISAANCLRIHRLTGTLDQILINGRASAARYEQDGTITRVQLVRALRENNVARSKLYRADCPPLK
jgi:hypothetical protein